MEYILKMKDYKIAKVEISNTDEYMAVQDGHFIPLSDYKKIKGIIKSYSQLVFELNIKDAERNKTLKDLRKKIQELGLELYSVNDKEIKCRSIDLRDYSDELGLEGYICTIYL